MPMNTTFDTRRSSSRAAERRSHHLLHDLAGGEVAFEPACPVAQNPQPIAQPAWLDTQTVTRSRYAISTVSIVRSSCSRHRNFTVSPPSLTRSVTSSSPAGSVTRQPFPQRLRQIGHLLGCEQALVQPVPHLPHAVCGLIVEQRFERVATNVVAGRHELLGYERWSPPDASERRRIAPRPSTITATSAAAAPAPRCSGSATASCPTCRSSSASPAPTRARVSCGSPGLAGLIAGAVSMAAGEYVSMKAQNELLERELDIERRELRRNPHVETVELAQIYQSRGVDPDRARELAEEMMRDPDLALQTHAREELGIDPDQLGLAARRGGLVVLRRSRSARYTAAAVVLRFGHGGRRRVSGARRLAACAVVGALLARFTGRSVLFSAGRQIADRDGRRRASRSSSAASSASASELGDATRRHAASVGAVDVVDREADARVEAHRGLVGSVDVQHPVLDAAGRGASSRGPPA